MRAAVGDWLRLGGRDADRSQRTGQIIEIHGADGEPPYLVRFRDGHTSLVVPGPEAVIRLSASDEPDEPATAPRLIFRVTASQRRALLITAGIVTVLVAVLGWAGLAAPAAGVGIAALFTVYYAVAYATAYTECTPAGLRARGVTWRQFLPWARLRDIAVRDYASAGYQYWLRLPIRAKPLRIVIVTADDGARFWLGAPIDGGQGLGDPEFEDKIAQIHHYWHSRMSSGTPSAGRPPADHDEPGVPPASQAGSGIPGVRADSVPGRALNAFVIRAARVAVVIAVLGLAAGSAITLRDAGPALSAALGHGHHGTFTAQAKSCPKDCLWYGDFVADNGTVERHVLLADGAAVTGKGESILATDVGKRGMVYPTTGAAELYPVITLLLLEIGPAICVLTWLTLRVRRRRRSRRLADLTATGRPAR